MPVTVSSSFVLLGAWNCDRELVTTDGAELHGLL